MPRHFDVPSASPHSSRASMDNYSDELGSGADPELGVGGGDLIHFIVFSCGVS